MTIQELIGEVTQMADEVAAAKKAVEEKQARLDAKVKESFGLDPQATVQGLVACVEKTTVLKLRELGLLKEQSA